MQNISTDRQGHFIIMVCVCVCAHGHTLNCVQLFVTPWTVAHQALLSMYFSRQEYWSGLPFPSLGDLPDPRIGATSLSLLHWQVDSLLLCHLGSPNSLVIEDVYVYV